MTNCNNTHTLDEILKATEKYNPNLKFKDIPGFDGMYEVSNIGGIVRHKPNGRIVEQNFTPEGYAYVNLYAPQMGKKKIGQGYYRVQRFVHRLVAETFVPNPRKVSTVDHIDNNRLNNDAINLQWLTNYENIMKEAPWRTKKYVIEVDTGFIFESAYLAAKFYDIDPGNISKCCRMQRLSYKGHIWAYASMSYHEYVNYLVKLKYGPSVSSEIYLPGNGDKELFNKYRDFVIEHFGKHHPAEQF